MTEKIFIFSCTLSSSKKFFTNHVAEGYIYQTTAGELDGQRALAIASWDLLQYYYSYVYIVYYENKESNA